MLNIILRIINFCKSFTIAVINLGLFQSFKYFFFFKKKINFSENQIESYFENNKDKYKKYDYEVPVVAVERIRSEEIIELPRISPRLKDDQLKNWFQKNISTILEK